MAKLIVPQTVTPAPIAGVKEALPPKFVILLGTAEDRLLVRLTKPEVGLVIKADVNPNAEAPAVLLEQQPADQLAMVEVGAAQTDVTLGQRLVAPATLRAL